jgi:hypothetical protein
MEIKFCEIEKQSDPKLLAFCQCKQKLSETAFNEILHMETVLNLGSMNFALCVFSKPIKGGVVLGKFKWCKKPNSR